MRIQIINKESTLFGYFGKVVRTMECGCIVAEIEGEGVGNELLFSDDEFIEVGEVTSLV